MTGDILLLVLIFLPILGAIAGYLIGRISRTARNRFADCMTVVEFALLTGCLIRVMRGETFTLTVPGILDAGLHLKLDGFRALYASIAGMMWMMTTIFSGEYLHRYRNRNRYYLFTLITFGATVGVFLSAGLFTSFIFFEIMSFTSYVMVVHDETPGAMRAGQTYIAVAILGGMVMLMGLFLLRTLVGTLHIDALKDACAALPADRRPTLYLAGALILFGFGAKAGMYPLHIWLPKAHPVAPAPASALLSGILTKAGVFGILVLSCSVFLHDRSWGIVILTPGVLTMVTGAVIAVFSINLKRTLACSSVSQIGFILVGIGMQCLLDKHNALAVWGSELHMVNHSLIKLVLFMTAGTIYMNLHKLDLNDLRGFGRGKPLLMLIFLCGYLGIAGVPLFNGYISKTLIHEGIVEYIELLEEAGKSIAVMKAVEVLFLFSGGLTVAYMTKLFICIFVEKNPDKALQAKYDSMNGHYMNLWSSLALGLSAVLLPVIGLFPGVFMKRMAELGQSFMHGHSPAHEIVWFSPTNLKGAAISLLVGAVVYLFFIRTLLMRSNRYVNRWPDRIDMEDALYRPFCRFLANVAVGFSSVFAWLGDKGLCGFVSAATVGIGSFLAWSGNRGLPRFAEFSALLVSRTAANLPDWTVNGLRTTVLKKLPVPKDDPGDYREHDLTLDLKFSEETENMLNSFSYGLVMFGIGFSIILIVLLF